METAIHIGNKVEKETVDNLMELFGSMFDSAHKNHMEQKTVRCAIRAIGRITEVHSVSLNNCNIVGDKIINVDEPEKD